MPVCSVYIFFSWIWLIVSISLWSMDQIVIFYWKKSSWCPYIILSHDVLRFPIFVFKSNNICTSDDSYYVKSWKYWKKEIYPVSIFNFLLEDCVTELLYYSFDISGLIIVHKLLSENLKHLSTTKQCVNIPYFQGFRW